MDIQEFIEKFGIPGRMVRTVAIATIDSKAKQDSCDVCIQPFFGDAKKVTRRQLINHFKLINGNKIRLIKWREKIPYTIFRDCNYGI